ncbi:hypothetical protein K788_00006035 (plasmid) [Paraburkholderia caribensis MBA4]|uniref:Uncharacterized protein n=1 Tax=Paraburkholderia caribensis MBA4 TaxID=1323664 RepID=A0A0P0RNM8_9BURK|nr:hypothetical protein K788_00006035 [Paraburkholderia caribensis MBA4]
MLGLAMTGQVLGAGMSAKARPTVTRSANSIMQHCMIPVLTADATGEARVVYAPMPEA